MWSNKKLSFSTFILSDQDDVFIYDFLISNQMFRKQVLYKENCLFSLEAYKVAIFVLIKWVKVNWIDWSSLLKMRRWIL